MEGIGAFALVTAGCGAIVANATHRDHDIRLLRHVVGQESRCAIGEIDVELTHDGDNLRVDMFGWTCPGRRRGVPTTGCSFKQGLAHL